MIALGVLVEYFQFTPSKSKVDFCGQAYDILISSKTDSPFPVHGEILREEAIMLLRRFYVQENEKGENTSRTIKERNKNNYLSAPDARTKGHRELKTVILPAVSKE